MTWITTKEANELLENPNADIKSYLENGIITPYLYFEELVDLCESATLQTYPLKGYFKIQDYSLIKWDDFDRCDSVRITLEQAGKSFFVAAQDQLERPSVSNDDNENDDNGNWVKFETYHFLYDNIRINKQELVTKFKPSLGITVATADEPVEKKSPRNIFTSEQRDKADRKQCLQYAVEAYLDKNVDGQWEGFKTFLDGKLKLPESELLCKKQSYHFYFEKVNGNGVYRKNPDGSKASKNPYRVAYVKDIIRKEMRKRKKIADQK